MNNKRPRAGEWLCFEDQFARGGGNEDVLWSEFEPLLPGLVLEDAPPARPAGVIANLPESSNPVELESKVVLQTPLVYRSAPLRAAFFVVQFPPEIVSVAQSVVVEWWLETKRPQSITRVANVVLGKKSLCFASKDWLQSVDKIELQTQGERKKRKRVKRLGTCSACKCQCDESREDDDSKWFQDFSVSVNSRRGIVGVKCILFSQARLGECNQARFQISLVVDGKMVSVLAEPLCIRSKLKDTTKSEVEAYLSKSRYLQFVEKFHKAVALENSDLSVDLSSLKSISEWATQKRHRRQLEGSPDVE